jgi:hypothetical protein
MAPTWDPAAFILTGRPTAPAELAVALEQIRQDSQAAELLLVSATRQKILRSVCLATEATTLGTDINSWIRHGPHGFSDPEEEIERLLGRSDEEVWLHLVEIMDLAPFTGYPHAATATVFRPTRRAAATGAIPILVAFGGDLDPTPIASAHDVIDLMVNTTANVDIAGDIMITTAVTRMGHRVAERPEEVVYIRAVA